MSNGYHTRRLISSLKKKKDFLLFVVLIVTIAGAFFFGGIKYAQESFFVKRDRCIAVGVEESELEITDIITFCDYTVEIL